MNRNCLCKQKGFTLAEVLIVIAIIGVIAVIVLNLRINIIKTTTAKKLQQTYSILYQAIKLSESENGDYSSWTYRTTGKNFYETYLEKYLKVSKKNVNISKLSYKQLNGKSMENWGLYFKEVSRISLTNGVYLYFFNSSQRSGDNSSFVFIYVDTNGSSPPNKLGKDLFYLVIDAQYGLTAYGLGKTNNKEVLYETKPSREILLGESNSHSCNKSKSGGYCLLLIMLDDWKIKLDYPW